MWVRKMNVKIMKPYGFCAGVEYVLRMIQQVIEDHKEENIYCIGQIVHNKSVNEEIRNQGIIVLEGNKEEIVEKIRKGVVVFSAHGTSKKIIQRAKEKGLIVYDAACPFVKKEMKDIYEYIHDGYEVIFVGVRGHDEANAILSISSRIHLISSIEDIEKTDIKTEKIVVVGDKHSNNTITLYNEAKKKNDNVVLCSSHDTLDFEQYKCAKDVLVVSGASVSKKRVEEIALLLKKIEK